MGECVCVCVHLADVIEKVYANRRVCGRLRLCGGKRRSWRRHRSWTT